MIGKPSAMSVRFIVIARLSRVSARRKQQA